MRELITVTKSKLIDQLVLQWPLLLRSDIEVIVNTVFDAITGALNNHNRIEIRDFGSFVAKKRKAREARNPRTGEHVNVPEKWIPFFTAGKGLRRRINKKNLGGKG